MKTKRSRQKLIDKNNYFEFNEMQLLQPYIELYTDFLLKNYSDELETSTNLKDVTDLSMPEEWYPDARSMQRRIIYHMGPTNSGKTKNAIEALSLAK